MTPTIEIKNRDDLMAKKALIWSWLCTFADGGGGAIQFLKCLRSIRQNRKMWPMLQDIAKQVPYAGQLRRKEDWKIILISSWRIVEKGFHPDIVPGLEGEFVCLNYSSSALSKKDFCSFIESIYAYGASNGVQWSEPALKAYDTYREAA